MSLLQDERTLYTAGELLLSSGPSPVWCQVTVEWLRGIPEPTWYGFFLPVDGEMGVLPGRYVLRLRDAPVEVLVRRPMPIGRQVCFPFWGLGPPPDIPATDPRGPDAGDLFSDIA
jgi:hypothetical protein